jgi:hypothetical protein
MRFLLAFSDRVDVNSRLAEVSVPIFFIALLGAGFRSRRSHRPQVSFDLEDLRSAGVARSETGRYR